MANPRLKINDQEIGLRDLGEGLLEPKSISILQDSIYGIKNEAKNPSFFTERGFSRKEPPKYYKIESFCFVVTEAMCFVTTEEVSCSNITHVSCGNRTNVSCCSATHVSCCKTKHGTLIK